MKPTTDARMEPGPALTPSSALEAWLAANATTAGGKRRVFRLPVVVRFEDEDRLAFESAHVAASPESVGADSLALELDDGAMGVGLLDQLRERCPEGQDACAVWLDGYWGELVDLDDDDGDGDSDSDGEGVSAKTFAVLRLHGMIDPADAASARAQLAVP